MATRHYIDLGSGFTEVVGRIRSPSPNSPGGGFSSLTSSAHGGDYGSGGVDIDDPLGTIEILGWRPYYAVEDEADPPRIYTGFINARTISQADVFEGPGTARVFECDLGDLNLILGLQCFRNKKRPLEDDLVRVAWMLANWPCVDYPVFDNGGVTTLERPNFDEADLDGEFPEETLNNMILGTRMFYLYWDETAAAGEEISLFFGPTTGARGTSDIKLSNDPDDESDPDVRFAIDPKIAREPGFTYSGAYVIGKNGKVYKQNETTAATYIRRDQVYRSDRIGATATLNTRADQLLERGSTEKDVLTCDVVLLNEDVNRVKEGYRIFVKFTHLPGYQDPDFTEVTIWKRSLNRPDNGALDRYIVTLELSNDKPGTGLGEGGGDPGDFPHPPPQPSCSDGIDAAISSKVDDSYSAGSYDLSITPPAPSAVLVAFVAGDPNTPGDSGMAVSGITTLAAYDTSHSAIAMGWATESGAATYTGTYTPGYGDFGNQIALAVAIPTAATAPVQSVAGSGLLTLPAAPTPGNILVQQITTASGAPDPYLVGSGWVLIDDAVCPGAELFADQTTLVYARCVEVGDDGSCGTSGLGPIHQSVVSEWLASAGAANPPSPGQEVGVNPPEYVVMSGVNGTTAWPFADNSLRVFYDFVEQTAAIVSYDGAAGTFVMAAAPTNGMQVTVRYQGR